MFDFLRSIFRRGRETERDQLKETPSGKRPLQYVDFDSAVEDQANIESMPCERE
jgi:hypothetical protein